MSAAPEHTTAPYASDAELLLDLIALLNSRLAALLAARRARTVTDPALKGLVITDTEVDELIAADLASESGAEFELGSLWAEVEPLMSEAELRWSQLRNRFRLSAFEMEVLLACLAPEVERRFERIYGYLNDGIAQRYPTADLLLRLLAPQSARAQLQAMFAPDARLLRFGLLASHAETAGAHATYRVTDGVVRFLLGQGGVDALLARAWCPIGHPPLCESLWSDLKEKAELSELMRTHVSGATRALGDTPLVVVVRGRAGSGRRFAVEAACRDAGRGCIALDARLLKRGIELEKTLVAAFRDSALAGAPVLLHAVDVWFEDAERFEELRSLTERLLSELGWMLFITTHDFSPLTRWCARARVLDAPMSELTPAQRTAAWSELLKQTTDIADIAREEIAHALAIKFRLTSGEIAEALFRALGTRREPAHALEWLALLTRHAAQVSAPRLRALAQQIQPTHDLDDLVLTPDKKDLLLDLVRRTRYRTRVMEEWGFNAISPRGRGLVALFYGPSGTGKTMAAEVIASELGLDLYRVDLAGVVSKYIGETEKNLRAIFDEADRADALLFFDEADALFGKRSEVRDAHDRYANIEINYLLQRIENFSGIAILATNMRQHLDEAFLRRIHVSVEFAVPKPAERLAIWERSFPQNAPLAADVDLRFFAERFEIPGGSIRNIALGAAFLAAESHASIELSHLIAAAQREFTKSGRRVQHSEFAPHAPPTPSLNGHSSGVRHGLSIG